MRIFLSDCRQSLRILARSPGSTFFALLMLAIGIGATAAIFSVFHAVLLTPLPFAEQDRLVQIWETRLHQGYTTASVTEANFWDIRASARTFEEIAGMNWDSGNLTGEGEPIQVSVARISAGFFSTLGVTPVAGRLFLHNEDQPGQDNQVVLLANEFWRRQFGANRAVIGRSLRLDDRSFTVVGVLPPGEPWLDAGDVFVPMVFNPKASRNSFELAVIGRLRPNVSIEAATADLTAVCNALAEEYPDPDKGMGISIQPASTWVAGNDLRTALWVLLGAVGFLLLIACVNLANLLLARAIGRTREIAIRAALGASRARVVRLVLTEAFALCLAGSALGLLVAHYMLEGFRLADPGGIPRFAEAGLNLRVLLFTVAVTLLTALFSGLVPALRAPYGNIVSAMREGERGSGSRTQQRLRSLLVSTEVALSLMLLIGAGLLIRSFGQLLGVERGFQTENRIVFSVNAPGSYGRERVHDLIQRFLEQAHASGPVISAAAVNSRPITGWNPGLGIVPAERPDAFDGSTPWATWRLISPGYFQTIGVPLLKGRAFTEQDEAGHPWRVVISQRVADLLWPGEDPIGRKAVLWKGQGDNLAEIIGVVGNMRERGLDSDPTLAVYIPYLGTGSTPIQFVVHAAGDPQKLMPAFRSALAQIDPSLPIARVQTFDQIIERSLSGRRFNTLLLSVFAGVALLLALAGIYGVLAYAVARRTAEIGVRVALGATSHNILRLIIGQGMRPILFGIAAGLAGAFWLSRFVAGLLFGIEAADPLTFAGVAAIVTLTALAACCMPALRALRINPVTALREE
jgi:putative ABC transport system permease protein